MAKFDDIIGQDKIKEYFKAVISNNKISHAYLIQGEQGCGKEYVARIIAKTLQCNNKVEINGIYEACGVCQSCKQAENKTHPDIITVKPLSRKKDKQKSELSVDSELMKDNGDIGVDDIREQINSDVEILPYSGDYKIYIVNEADKLNIQAQNALLKTFEEPPKYVIIILLVENVSTLLDTIMSRAVLLRMQPVDDNILEEYLINVLGVSKYKVNLCIAYARGNLGKAKQIATNEDYDEILEETLRMLKNLKEMEVSEVIESIKKINNLKMNITEYLDLINVWYRDVLLFKATNDTNGLIFKNELQAIKSVANTSSYAGIECIISALAKTKDRVRANVNVDLAIELLFYVMKEN